MKEKMIGQIVYHDVFGKGMVLSCSPIYITVQFADEKKSFMFPDSFLSFLKAEDQQLQNDLVKYCLSDKEPEKCSFHQDEGKDNI